VSFVCIAALDARRQKHAEIVETAAAN
jgi:hypothetical protein